MGLWQNGLFLLLGAHVGKLVCTFINNRKKMEGSEKKLLEGGLIRPSPGKTDPVWSFLCITGVWNQTHLDSESWLKSWLCLLATVCDFRCTVKASWDPFGTCEDTRYKSWCRNGRRQYLIEKGWSLHGYGQMLHLPWHFWMLNSGFSVYSLHAFLPGRSSTCLLSSLFLED